DRWASTHLPTFKNTTQGKWLLPEDFWAIAGILVSVINELTRVARCASRFPMSRLRVWCPGIVLQILNFKLPDFKSLPTPSPIYPHSAPQYGSPDFCSRFRTACGPQMRRRLLECQKHVCREHGNGRQLTDCGPGQSVPRSRPVIFVSKNFSA